MPFLIYACQRHVCVCRASWNATSGRLKPSSSRNIYRIHYKHRNTPCLCGRCKPLKFTNSAELTLLSPGSINAYSSDFSNKWFQLKSNVIQALLLVVRFCMSLLNSFWKDDPIQSWLTTKRFSNSPYSPNSDERMVWSVQLQLTWLLLKHFSCKKPQWQTFTAQLIKTA